MSAKARKVLLLAATAGLAAVAAVMLTTYAPQQARALDLGRNVILITLDGVRYEEVFDGAGYHFPYMTEKVRNQRAALLGDPRQGNVVVAGNPYLISLPAYYAIFAGSVQRCNQNACRRTWSETFPERIKQDLGLTAEQVATFASWEKLAGAVESWSGTTFVDAGQTHDEPSPFTEARMDEHTWLQAMQYLEAQRPRFLYVSLNDSDEWGHEGDFPQYLATLHRFDDWLRELDERLARMPGYGERTCVVITTDHGRGAGKQWRDHDASIPNAAFVWLYTSCAGESYAERPVPTPSFRSLLDVRPTIEAMFGLAPTICDDCGTTIAELVPEPQRSMSR